MLLNVPCDVMAKIARILTTSKLLALRLIGRSILPPVCEVLSRRGVVISPPEYTIQALRAFPNTLFLRSVAPEACTLNLCVDDEARSADAEIEFLYALATANIFSRVGATRLEIANMGTNLMPVSLDRLELIVSTLPRLKEARLADITLRPSVLSAIRTSRTLRVIDVALEGVESKEVCSTIAALGDLRAIRVRCILLDARPLDGMRDIASALRGMPSVMEVDFDVRHARDPTSACGEITTERGMFQERYYFCASKTRGFYRRRTSGYALVTL